MYDTMKIADTILDQLGGNRFIAMTGAKNFVSDGNTLRMTLPKNGSKANRLYITLDMATDTYTMRFFHYTAPRMNHKIFAFSSEKIKEVYETSGIYCDQLQSIFTSVTGFYTHL